MINSASYRSYRLQVENSQSVFEEIDFQSAPQRFFLFIKARLPKYCKHALLWIAVYFCTALFFNSPGTGFQSAFTTAGTAGHLVPFVVLIAFAYLNYYYLVSALSVKKDFAVYLFFMTVFVLGMVIWRRLAFPGSQAFSQIIILFIAVVMATVIARLLSILGVTEKELTKTKTSFLNAQIKPHFILNSLNSIYLLAVNESEETPDAIMQLSGLMRYLLKDAHAEFTDLKKELEYIKNYLKIQQRKLGNTVSLNCSIPVYTGTLKIAPLLIMSFIENAFKYGVNPEQDSAINIDISVINDRFYLEVINNKVYAHDNTIGSGIGIENARQRLHLQYPSQHRLEILDDARIYSVKLSIMLQ